MHSPFVYNLPDRNLDRQSYLPHTFHLNIHTYGISSLDFWNLCGAIGERFNKMAPYNPSVVYNPTALQFQRRLLISLLLHSRS